MCQALWVLRTPCRENLSERSEFHLLDLVLVLHPGPLEFGRELLPPVLVPFLLCCDSCPASFSFPPLEFSRPPRCQTLFLLPSRNATVACHHRRSLKDNRLLLGHALGWRFQKRPLELLSEGFLIGESYHHPLFVTVIRVPIYGSFDPKRN